jgi:magnesium chelatase family protein
MITVYSAKCIGIQAVPVCVEVDVTGGIGIHLVGLADVAVKESLLRTVTALQACGFRIPGKKIIINLAPADLHKNGSGYDLPIALGILAATGQIELPDVGLYLFMGELSLDGQIRGVQGALPVVDLARSLGESREGADEPRIRGVVLPLESAVEAVDFIDEPIYAISNLAEAIRIAKGEGDLSDLLVHARVSNQEENVDSKGDFPDFSEILGQDVAKRGMEIAAAGCHNVILIGPPGAGKSSLAKALAGIMPPMSHEESLQTSKIYSVSGRKQFVGLMRGRPFRQPHYTSSLAALLGGGSEQILPGEVSLAHNGVLFLDEFCEAPKRVTEALRAPLEDRKVVISRLRRKVEFPASFMLVAATNPCPCGYYGDGDRCSCSEGRRLAYLARLSGPMMDRIDIQLWTPKVDARKLIHKEAGESSAVVAARVLRAREIQRTRFAQEGIFCNSEMNNRQMEKYCPLDKPCRELLEKIIVNMGLSARAYSRIVKLSRTIADLAGVPDILPEHISEAASYRFLDKQI